MGVAIYKFIEEKDEQGQILSAFYYGYLCTQLLGGVLSTKFGAKRVLMTGLLVWTLCVRINDPTTISLFLPTNSTV